MEKKFKFINKDISILDCIGLCAHNITALDMLDEIDEDDSTDILLYQFMFSRVDIRLFNDNTNNDENLRIIHGYYLMCHTMLNGKDNISRENIRYLNFIWNKIIFYNKNIEIHKGRSGACNTWLYPIHLHFENIDYVARDSISKKELSGLCCHNVLDVLGERVVKFLMTAETELKNDLHYNELNEEIKTVELKYDKFFPIY